jgi:hypothetical protein
MKLSIRNDVDKDEEQTERELGFYLEKENGCVYLMCKDMHSGDVDFIAKINEDGYLIGYRASDLRFYLPDDKSEDAWDIGKFEE